MSVPPEIIEAAKEGDVDTLRNWFESGTRDPNVLFTDSILRNCALLHEVLSHPSFHPSSRKEGRSDRADAVRLLLAHGADANLCRAAPRGIKDAPLMMCQFQGEMDALLDGGAEVDARNEIGRTALMNCFTKKHGLVLAKLLLRRGANCYLQDAKGLDAEATTLRHGYGDSKASIINLIREVKSAGSWKAYERAPRVELVRLRSLCARGRATPPHAASGSLKRLLTLSAAEMVIFERLFAFPSSPTTKTKAARVTPLPNEVFWHVLSFWRSSRDD